MMYDAWFQYYIGSMYCRCMFYLFVISYTSFM